MKKLIFLSVLLTTVITVSGQQFPILEGYNLNPYSLSPSYAGLVNRSTVYADYRSDWSGIEGGPKTYQLSYSDRFSERVGLGGKFIYDKTDIFKQTLIMGSYTYTVDIARRHKLTFGLSAGFYKHSMDLGKYYNNPEYVQDMLLIYGVERSKLKFASDFSALYRAGALDVGVLFTNLMFGTVRYDNSDLNYKPLKNYVIHGSYLVSAGDHWKFKPTVVFRGGENTPLQFEVAPTITWNDRLWLTGIYRSNGILGAGLGGEVYDGFYMNYTYNMSTGVDFSAFGSHQFTLGMRIIRR
jgi:type IX secretion system PorP/SprF family membrane protein